MIPATQPRQCLHFGCIDRAGHHVHSPARSAIDSTLKEWIGNMDGQLHTETTDRWLRHRFEAADGTQITFIAKRDNNVDTRPGSWCGFVMPGNRSLDTALRVAQLAWPQLPIWRT